MELHRFIDIPFTNPTLIFFIVLVIILMAPVLLNKIKVPHIIGMILAGMVIGPNGLDILERDSSFEIFGKVGLLYLMFLAGLEMDMNDFRKNKFKGLVFGLYTFIIPMVIGTLVSYYLFHFSIITSILLSSMYASHTLVAYPIVSRYGVTKHRSVTITIAGTIVTVLLALIILAIITGMYKDTIDHIFWIKMGISIIIYTIVLFIIFPKITKWFLRKYEDNVTQYIFVLSLVFAASFGAELSGLEGIIGAFLAGIILNRFIPSVSPLMNRIEFVGNALFIPYFLIGVGMLVDLRVLFSEKEAIVIAVTMSVIATLSKWIAAWLTQKTYSLSKLERNMIFGLSNGQAAATLAAVLIGYNIITGYTPEGEPIRLLNESILNGTIIMILVTCIISSIVTEQSAEKMALIMNEESEIREKKGSLEERILIPVANPATLENLVNLAITLKSPVKRSPLYTLSVDLDAGDDKMVSSKQILSQAAKIASSADIAVNSIARYDVNVASGILHTIKENNITEVVTGFHHKANIADTFFGQTIQHILKGSNCMLSVVKALTPINTLNKIVVAVPQKAEYESGFERWIDRIANLSSQVGCRVVFNSTRKTEDIIKKIIAFRKYNFRHEFYPLDNWGDFIALSRFVKIHDLFVVISARRNSLSYHHSFEKLPEIISKDFSHTNLLVIYPEQFEAEPKKVYFSDPQAINITNNYNKIFSYLNFVDKLKNKSSQDS